MTQNETWEKEINLQTVAISWFLKETKTLTRWCHCQSPRGTRPCAGRRGGGIQEASGSSGLGQNRPRSQPRSVPRLHCIPAQAGLGRALDLSVKPQKQCVSHNQCSAAIARVVQFTLFKIIFWHFASSVQDSYWSQRGRGRMTHSKDITFVHGAPALPGELVGTHNLLLIACWSSLFALEAK